MHGKADVSQLYVWSGQQKETVLTWTQKVNCSLVNQCPSVLCGGAPRKEIHSALEGEWEYVKEVQLFVVTSDAE